MVFEKEMGCNGCFDIKVLGRGMQGEKREEKELGDS
jgi:hypothetical protein